MRAAVVRSNVSAAPAWCVPHQPRLDWQMWFAALGSVQRQPWLVHLAFHLLRRTPAVLALMPPAQPFTAAAPATHVRARLFRYHYTFLADAPAAWWRREPTRGLYMDALSLPQLAEIRARMGYAALPAAAVAAAAPPPAGLARGLALVRGALGAVLGDDGGKILGFSVLLAALGLRARLGSG
jgi:hypothetical protein